MVIILRRMRYAGPQVRHPCYRLISLSQHLQVMVLLVSVWIGIVWRAHPSPVS